MIYGIICYILSLTIIFIFSTIYLFRSSFMPYHRDAVQRTWNETDTRMQQVLLALIHALGIAWLSSLSFCVWLLIILLSGPVIFWQLAIFQILYLFSALAPVLVAIKLRMQTGARTPVASGVAAAVLSILGFICILLF